MIENDYVWVSMRIIPASDFSKDNLKVLLFVQTDDSAESLELVSTAKQQFAIMRSLAGIYITMHVIDLKNDSVYDFANNSGTSKFTMVENAVEMMKAIMNARVTKESLEAALEFTDLTTIKDRLGGQNVLERDFLGKNVGWFRAQFIPIKIPGENELRYVIFTTSNIDKEKKREEKIMQLSTELSLSTEIQANAIPHIFPAFPERKEFDIFASMTPAKEVGGDFYDFFFIDDDHFAMVIADVSGKGIPAALFMMVSQVLIKNQSHFSKSPAEILENVNNMLCEKNKAEMFVTVWLGILNLKTGKLTAANAGHEYPAIKRKDGKFEILKDKHGFVVGGMSGMKYKEYEMQLNPGDNIFVYTDGVVEATNAQYELFGTEKMINALNIEADCNCKQIVSNVKKHIDNFVKEAPQFDDITMLCLKYNGK